MKSLSSAFGLLAAAVAALVMTGCKKSDERELPPRPVLSIVVSQQADTPEGFAGTVEPRYQSDLSFRTIGRVQERYVKVGDQVSKGQILATLDPTPLDLAVRAARADLESYKAQMQNAAADESRRRILFNQRNVSAETFEASQQARESAEASLLRAKTALEKAEEQRTYADLRAEYDAVVTSVYMEVGQMAASGNRSITIAQPNVRDAVIDVPDDLAPSLEIGSRFRIELQAHNSAAVRGVVREISPQIDALTHTRRIKIAIEDPGPDYRLGTLITAYLEGGVTTATRLPASAILDRQGKTFVWLVDTASSTVSEREISLAARNDKSVRVAAGLDAGARVVVAGVNSLTPGQKVRILDAVNK